MEQSGITRKSHDKSSVMWFPSTSTSNASLWTSFWEVLHRAGQRRLIGLQSVKMWHQDPEWFPHILGNSKYLKWYWSSSSILNIYIFNLRATVTVEMKNRQITSEYVKYCFHMPFQLQQLCKSPPTWQFQFYVAMMAWGKMESYLYVFSPRYCRYRNRLLRRLCIREASCYTSPRFEAFSAKDFWWKLSCITAASIMCYFFHLLLSATFRITVSRICVLVLF